MDTQQKDTFLNYTLETAPPAQLFIGSQENTTKAALLFLQTIFCKKKACQNCTACLQISRKQHYALMWIQPDKGYTLDLLEDLFNTLSFQLQENDHFFFVMNKADFLSITCANKLLKPMEEPPHGYHFILLAEHQEQIPVTIKSRCVTHLLHSPQSNTIDNPLVEAFTKKPVSSDQFAKIISMSINERESIEFLDQIIHYWLNNYSKNHPVESLSIIKELHKAQLTPPMPGSSTIFWHNLYMQLHDQLKNFSPL